MIDAVRHFQGESAADGRLGGSSRPRASRIIMVSAYTNKYGRRRMVEEIIGRLPDSDRGTDRAPGGRTSARAPRAGLPPPAGERTLPASKRAPRRP